MSVYFYLCRVCEFVRVCVSVPVPVCVHVSCGYYRLFSIFHTLDCLSPCIENIASIEMHARATEQCDKHNAQLYIPT